MNLKKKLTALAVSAITLVSAVPFAGSYSAEESQEADTTILKDIDLDGDLDTQDISILSQYLVKKATPEAGDYTLADVNGDGAVNVFDLISLKRIVIENSKEDPTEPTEVPTTEAPSIEFTTPAPTEATEVTTTAVTEATTVATDATEATTDATEATTEVTEVTTKAPIEVTSIESTTQEPTEVTTSAATTTEEKTTAETTSATVSSVLTDGTSVVTVNTTLNTSDGSKTYGVKISDLVPDGAKADKFIVAFSADENIESVLVGGGIAVTNNENYWSDLTGTVSINGTSGTVEFDVSSIRDDIDYEKGEFEVGYWSGDAETITIDSITCVYSTGTSATTSVTTSAAVTTSTTVSSVLTEETTVISVGETINTEEGSYICQVNIPDLVPKGAKAVKFIVNFTTAGDIGEHSIGGGISVTNNEGYWLNITGTENISGSSGTIEFDLSEIKDVINYDDGIFQVGYWWGDAETITIDSITCVYSTDDTSAVTTSVTTSASTTTTTTTTVVATTTAAPVTTTSATTTKTV